MNILYVAAEASNFVINLCNEFCKQGHYVTCVIQDFDHYDPENPIKKHPNITEINLPLNTFLNPVRLLRIVEKHLEHGKYDIVFGSHAPISPIVVVAANKYKIPSGVMLLDIPTDLIHLESNRKRLWNDTFPFIMAANLIITNTGVCAEELEKWTGRKIPKEDVITYAINLHPMFNTLEIKKKEPYVVSVCRLSTVKNCILIPKALKLLDRKLKYVAIGRDNGELENIKKYCKTNNIEFEYLGTVSEYRKFEIIRNASALIYPQDSEYIGGLSPFESMYTGTPSIVPELRILKDLYEDNAFYFENNNEQNLANTIESICTFPPDDAFYKKAHKHAKYEGSFSVMAKRMIERMKTVIR